MMRNYMLVVLITLLSGCVSPYAYKSISTNDPEIIFGERMGDIGARGFNINVNDASANKCKDFMNVGAVANTGKILDKTKTIRTPVNKAIAIRSNYHSGSVTCEPGVKLFTPESGGKYSVDIGTIGRMCFLSIARIQSGGKIEEVKEFSVLPKCE